MNFIDMKLHLIVPICVSVPAVDHDGGVVIPVGSDSVDKLNERAAWRGDAVLRPRRVVEVTDQNVVPVLHRHGVNSINTVRDPERQLKLSLYFQYV